VKLWSGVLCALFATAGAAWAGCPATPVHGARVSAGVFTGYLTPPYDMFAGRFRLRVGPYRDRKIGLSQKIPWYARPGSKVGDRLVVSGLRVGPRPVRRFRQTFVSAGEFPQGTVFPSNIEPPAPGCWQLTFRSGRETGKLLVLVRR
jgi:hypothetical protein